jgi:predicted Zn finger-like uncharacterized protein
MDVRCERCQTEYELEDSSVSHEGTQVQCTACGNTFLVTPLHVAPPAPESDGSPAVAEWLLETPEGPAHRFRNLTSLQKWIIERKVTREDRISRTGHAWRRLGEIVELAPFFDVVDEADQAKAALGGRAPKGEARAERTLAAPATSAAPAGARPAESFLEPSTDVMRLRARSVLRLVILIAVAVAVAYAGITQLWLRHPLLSAVVPLVSAPSTLMVPPAAPAPEPAPPLAAAAAAVPSPAGSSPPSAPAPRPAAAAPATAAAPTYEKLVTEADHALERGATDRARKVYDQALKLRPTGVEALAGLGYVALDRGRTDRAFFFFKRAIAQQPGFAPALFGLGEAYRASGDDEVALEHYRRYISADPKAVDAAAARRQIQSIEERLATRAAGGPTTPPPP